MLQLFKFHKIRKLKKCGKNNVEIGKELTIDRRTVAKYLKQNKPPNSSNFVSERKSKFDGFEEKAKSLIEKHDGITGPEILEVLSKQGLSCSERTIQRKLAKIKATKNKERFFEQSYEYGEQAQFDFKELITIPFLTGDRKIHLVYGTLPASDLFYIKGFPRKTFECFVDGIHSFFEFIDGIPDNVRIDNLSPCVRSIGKGSIREFTVSFERMINRYGFKVLPCSPGKGNEKGDVEREIRTHSMRIQRMLAIDGIKFENFEQLNSWLYEYCKKYKDKNEKAKLELIKLNPLLQRDDSVLCKTVDLRVNKFGTVRISHQVYSVPDYCIGQKCKVVTGPFDIKIFQIENNEKLVAIHENNEKSSVKLEHVIGSLVKKPHAMIRWSHRHVLFPNEIFLKFYNNLKKNEELSAERIFLQCMNLIQTVAIKDLEFAIEIILSEKIDKNIFDELKSLLIPGSSNFSFEDIDRIYGQEKINPSLQEFDELI